MTNLKIDPERCSNCKWMRKREVVQQLPPLQDKEGRGVVMVVLFCHRFPTVLKTEHEHWCGEWKLKETSLV